MAAPFKRVCCQAARNSSRNYRSRIPQAPLAESSQWQKACPLSSSSILIYPKQLQNRTYTTSIARHAARPNQRPRKDEGLALSQDLEDDLEPEYLVDEADISSAGHAELEQHREVREMVRTAAWEMPLLTQLAKPFTPPDTKKLPLRWRYTTYMGDSHPASRKVVVEFNIHDLPDLSDKQKLKLQKLVGARLNLDTNVVRMSCESFETQAQNKRYLGDTIQKLLAEVKDPNADSFEDIPLDTRHHKVKKRLRFPEEWKLTAERRAQLEERRRTQLLEEGKKVEDGAIVSGLAAIEAARQLKLKMAEEKPVMVEPKKLSR